MTGLLPADMPAVLQRTNLPPNHENLLLPIYEAISNAIYACEDRWGADFPTKGNVVVEVSTSPFSATVSDNGVGLGKANLLSFRTPFTGTKLKRGGKGFGRFIAFKVFDDVQYFSRPVNEEEFSFKFDIYSDDELIENEAPLPLEFDAGTVVQLSNVKKSFENSASSINDDGIVDRIIRYFLPNFLKGQVPVMKMIVDSVIVDVSERSSKFFPISNIQPHSIDIQGEPQPFDIGLAKVDRSEMFPHHMMMLFADGRIIGSGRNIERKIGTSHFENDAGQKQVYVATVSGDYLDARANTARTQIEASESEIDDIVSFVADLILASETAYVERHRDNQSSDTVAAISRNPLLRAALRGRSIRDYVASKPMSWRAEEFVSDLALTRYRDQTRWDRIFDNSLKAPENLKEMREELVRHLDMESKDALAAYVSHRRSVIDLADTVLGWQDNGRMSLEDVFHDLVHPRYEDTETTKFYQHNLLLIDDRLAFFSYVSSDRTIHGGRRSAGDKVADIVLFDDCSVYREGDENTIVLVEFKRPGRNDYRFGNVKLDPVQQLFETALDIRETGRLVTSSGRTLSVRNGVRIFGYVVADLEPTLRAVCENHDMSTTWDDRGYYRYHEKRDVFVEVLGYDKMVDDAKKRNSAFFEILLGDLGV